VIGQRVAHNLANCGHSVRTTRTGRYSERVRDTTVTADLWLSIHLNAVPSGSPYTLALVRNDDMRERSSEISASILGAIGHLGSVGRRIIGVWGTEEREGHRLGTIAHDLGMSSVMAWGSNVHESVRVIRAVPHEIPAIVLEPLFLDHPKHMQYLDNARALRSLADRIAYGVDRAMDV